MCSSDLETHGPITAVQPPSKAGKGDGEAPVKLCPECAEICHASVKVCNACGYQFPLVEPPKLKLRDDDIMGLDNLEMEVSSWSWHVATSKSNGKQMLKITYYGDLDAMPVREYLCIKHDGYAGHKAVQKLFDIAYRAGVTLPKTDELSQVASIMEAGQHPAMIEYRKSGKFYEVKGREWQS